MGFLKRYKDAVKRHFAPMGVSSRYDPAPEKVLATIQLALDEPFYINELIWSCLAEVDPRICRDVCREVYDGDSWDNSNDTMKLRKVFKSLLEPPKPIDWDDYL